MKYKVVSIALQIDTIATILMAIILSRFKFILSGIEINLRLPVKLAIPFHPYTKQNVLYPWTNPEKV